MLCIIKKNGIFANEYTIWDFMRLSIITITYNNLFGLQRTVVSVMAQTWHDWELIVVDGGSSDGTQAWLNELHMPAIRWISETDKGVYDAQNKGIRMATGDYCFFLNAGDVFCTADVLERMFAQQCTADILYGNEVVVDASGKRVGYCKGVERPAFLDLYLSCMKHQATFIRREMFARYGTYDDTLQIVADWEWFFRVIGFHNEVTLLYRDVDISLFENTGISYHAPELCATERQVVLDHYMSRRMQEDYILWAHYPHLRKIVGDKLLERVLRFVNKVAKKKKRMS